MTKTTKNASAAKSIHRLADIGFQQMEYWIWVTPDKFDSEKFRQSLGPKARDRDSFTTAVAPKDPKAGDYYIVAFWQIEKDEISFRIGYYVGSKEHAEDEHEPYAEQFMEWLGQFFKHETAEAHIHARFKFPLETRKSKFPLPLKTSLEGDAEIDGISLRLPAKPQGVSKVRLTQGKTLWYTEVVADRRITFKGFSPDADVQAFMFVMGTLIEEAKQ